MKWQNPLAFRPGPVTFWTTAVYIAVLVPLLYVHETVPSVPSDRALPDGINLTEAWHDLQTITRSYHPYNSHQNDVVRQFIMDRSRQILEDNGVDYTSERAGGVQWNEASEYSPGHYSEGSDDASAHTVKPAGATLFDDQTSNVTWTYDTGTTLGTNIGPSAWMGQYFEGNNYYIYIHGKDDPEGNWWLSEAPHLATRKRGAGVMVNCHIDSVSTGYGATDDGVGCVTMLQLLRYFTSTGHQPKNGIVLLFNNAEEDGLLGARAFAYSPLVRFIHTFVNLEGAGAGGRAVLFRTTDLQTAKAYSGTPHPFGSVVAANAFERGVIKSATDYQIFADVFGHRGMDIAFYAPRSRYHTEEDDARHTSVDSIWHMLSAALASTERLVETAGTTFTGERSDGRADLVQNGKPTEGVWFDWFGKGWTAFPLRGLFAWSLTLLVATPLALLLVTYLLIRNDKYYFFADDVKTHSDIDDDSIPLGGWKGFTRFPVALVFAVLLTVASVLLVAKFNPFIIYSSAYAVWAMTLSIFYFVFWLIMRGSSFVRPSALHRGFSLIWLFIISWTIQVFAAVAEDRMHIAALYTFAFLHSAVFLCLMMSLLELFALPGKHYFTSQLHDARQERDASDEQEDVPSGDGDHGGDGQGDNSDDEDTNDATSPTERTPLRTGEQGYGGTNNHTTFASTYRRSINPDVVATPTMPSYPPYDHEQSWSGRLPTWTWIIQLLLLAPVHVILLGNLGLVQMAAMSMTGTDGSSLLAPVLGLGMISILLLLPMTPFIHRVTHHIPIFLLLILVGTFIYNLVAFPFSINHRFKFNFQQVINLDDATNVVNLSGIEEFVRPVISSLPTAAGQKIECHPLEGRDLMDCQYDASALPPLLADDEELENLMTVTVSKPGEATASVQLDALNTRTCALEFSRPVFGFSVEGGGKRDGRFGSLPKDGLQRIVLWRREWTGAWNVTVQLAEDEHSRITDDIVAETIEDDVLEVMVRCSWSDVNRARTIPAFHELLKYMPKWAVVSKKTVGLVEVRKTYKITA